MPQSNFRPGAAPRRFSRAALITVAALLFGLLGLRQPASAADGTVTGRIVEPNGTTVVTSGNMTLRSSNWTYSQYQSLGSDGRFTFSGVPAGSYFLEIWANPSVPNSAFNPDTQTVTVTNHQTTALGDIRMLAPNVFGKVVRSDGTTAVTNGSVTIRTGDWGISRYASLDASGVFKMALSTQTNYVVEVYTWDTTESRPDNVTITYAGAPIYLDGTNASQALRTNVAAMRGRVLVPGGTGAQYASLTLYDSNNVGVQWSSTDQDGFFKMDSVPTGSYRLRINPPYSPSGLATPDDIAVSLTKGTVNTSLLTTPVTLTQSAKRIIGRVTRARNGAAITDASVSAWQQNGGGYANGTVDSSGNFNLLVSSGGTWQVSIWPSYQNNVQPDWTLSGNPNTVRFALSNTQAESQTSNFSVATLSATIQGTIYTPGGAPVYGGGSDYYSVSAWSDRSYGGGGWSQVNSSGAYSMRIAPGTYTVSVYGSMTYGAPQQTITVKEDETVTLNVTLLARNATITGLVQDNRSRGIASQWCSAWSKSGSGWGSGSTDSNGRYSFNVTAGTYYVSCYPSGGSMATSPTQSGTRYVSTDPPQEVTVAANGTVTADVVFAIADATISGKLVDQSGSPVSSVWGWVNAQKCNSTLSTGFAYYGGLGGSITSGTFSLGVPGGCWTLRASLGYLGDYTSASAKEVTVDAGGTVSNVELQLVPNNATVAGSVVDANGTTLTDAYGSVFLTDGANYRWVQITNGTYSLKTSAGAWNFGCWLDPATTTQYYMVGVCDTTVTATANATTTHNLVLQRADSTLIVKTLKPNGDPLPNAHLSVGTSFGATKTTSYSMYGSWYNPDRTTNQNGQATFMVPAGTYFVSASISTDFGYMNPPREVVTAVSDAQSTVTLQFLQPDATISGTVTKGGATYTGGGTITAYSAEGGYSEADVQTDGTFSLPATKNDVWVVSAGNDATATTGLASDETAVDVPASGKATTTLELGDTVIMPTPTTTTFATNTDQTVTTGGVTVNAPANTLTTQNATVSLTITPTVEERPSTATDSPIGPAYDISVTKTSGSDSGSPVTDLAGSLTITLPYTDADLTATGASESTLTVQSWDPTADTYTEVQGYSVDKANNKVSFSTSHLSKFVITTAPVEKTGTPVVTPGGSLAPGTDAPVITPDFVNLKVRNLAVVYGNTKATVAIYDAEGALVKKFRPYGAAVTASLKVIAADVLTTNNGEELIIYSPSNPNLPVKVFSLTGRELGKTTGFQSTSVNVMTADLNADGTHEIVVSGAGQQTIDVYGFISKSLKRRVMIKTAWSNGAEVLAGNLTGSDADELVVAPNDGTTVTIYTVDLKKRRASAVAAAAVKFAASGQRLALANTTGNAYQEIVLWPADDSGTIRILGLNGKRLKTLSRVKAADALALTLGDVNADGRTDIVVLSTKKNQPTVRLLSFRQGRMTTTSVTAALPTSIGVPDVAVGDVDADGVGDVIVAAGGSSRVYAYSYRPGSKTLSLVTAAYVGAKKSTAGNRVTITDLNGDGKREVVVTPRGQSPTLTILNLQKKKFVTSKRLKPAGAAYQGSFGITAASTK